MVSCRAWYHDARLARHLTPHRTSRTSAVKNTEWIWFRSWVTVCDLAKLWRHFKIFSHAGRHGQVQKEEAKVIESPWYYLRWLWIQRNSSFIHVMGWLIDNFPCVTAVWRTNTIASPRCRDSLGCHCKCFCHQPSLRSALQRRPFSLATFSTIPFTWHHILTGKSHKYNSSSFSSSMLR